MSLIEIDDVTSVLSPPIPPGARPGAAPGGRDWKFGAAFARLFVYPNGQGPPVYIPTTRVEIHSTEFQHEVAICYVKRTPENERLLCRHLPAYIQYGRLPQQWQVMVGYVAHQEPAKYGVDPENEFAIFMIGPTWKLKEPRPFTWTGKTTDRIIREVAVHNRLSADVVLGTMIWNFATATADETQWQFLVRLCQRSGMTLVPRLTQIFARRRDDITRADVERAEFFYEGLIRSLNVIADPVEEPGPYQRISDDVPNEVGNPSLHYVRPGPPERNVIEQLCGRNADDFVEGVGAPPGTRPDIPLPTRATESTGPFRRPEVPQGLVPADVLVAAEAERRASAFPVNALCITDGSARVQAGKVLRILPDEKSAWSGMWYVKSAWHVFQGRQGTGDNNVFRRPGVQGDGAPPPDYFLRMELGDRDLPDPINAAPGDEDGFGRPNRPGRRPRPRPSFTPRPSNPPRDDEPARPNPQRPVDGVDNPDQVLDIPVLTPTQPPSTTLPEDGPSTNPGTPGVQPEAPPVTLTTALDAPTCPLPPPRFLPSEWSSSMIADPGPPENVRPDRGPALVI